jgi:type II secretory pathway predicted ATPase ExeA
MSAVLQQIATQIVLMLVGALGTGIFWVARALLQARKDIDAAHIKLRCIEKQISKGE